MVKRIKYHLYKPGERKAEQVIRYLRYKDTISLYARKIYRGEPMTGAVRVDMTFYLRPPDSWSEKKKREHEGKLHTKKPDRDNLEKGVCDALNKIVWKDDGQVCDGVIVKRYSRDPRVEIDIQEVS